MVNTRTFKPGTSAGLIADKNKFANKGYDITKETIKLEKIYLTLLKDRG